jgi:hypothetical protein
MFLDVVELTMNTITLEKKSIVNQPSEKEEEKKRNEKKLINVINNE